jgi:hypothetical protein
LGKVYPFGESFFKKKSILSIFPFSSPKHSSNFDNFFCSSKCDQLWFWKQKGVTSAATFSDW